MRDFLTPTFVPVVMTNGTENQDNDAGPGGVEGRILEDDRRRSGEFLRDFLSRHRVDTSDDGADDSAVKAADAAAE